MIRRKLEYASKKEIKNKKIIQRIAIKMVPELLNMAYEDGLRIMELLTLEQRRGRGDMIMLYKLVIKIDTIDKDDLSLRARLQGLREHGKKLRKEICLRFFKKYSFPQKKSLKM